MEISLGPNHPSTHGVLRLVVTLDGETVVGLHNELGYVHTGIEKNMEQKSYWKAITYAPRADYNAFFCNELVYVMGVEKLLGLEVPRRGEWIRALFTELQRLHNHLIFLGTGSIDLGGIGLLFYCFRERDRVLDLFEIATGVRMHARYAQVGGVAEDIPAGFDGETRKFLDVHARPARRVRGHDRREPDLHRPHARDRRDHARLRAPDGPDRARTRAPPASTGTCACTSRTAPTASSASRRLLRAATATRTTAT